MTIDTNYFKEKLLTEKLILDGELKDIKKDHPSKLGVIETKDDVAERMEEQSEQRATKTPLIARLKNVELALKKIEEGKYGTCEVDEKPIEKDRLEANPAARTCIKHMDDEGSFN